MKFEKIKDTNEENFRRISGVKKETFYRMCEILKREEQIKYKRGGRPNKLSLENRLLMTLEYLREYRTYAHIGASYGLSESNTFENIRWIENVLIKAKEFKLPGKKALLKKDVEHEVVLIDATESPIERPKKNSENSFLARKNVIH